MLLADTGFFLALANKRDHWHPAATAALADLDESLLTSWPVLTETCHLLTNRLSPASAVLFMRAINNGAAEVADLTSAEVKRLPVLMRQYESLPMDLADASLVVLAERLGSGRILSTDERDFTTYRWKRHLPFENLLPPLR